ncbi:glycosyl hydrolase 108 family protein [Mesorhizobium kowhaii]|uniref:glycosyl hydrolase 108 family protein n=1 Tax=Mesorhizobium kowhaii TaxID=1300272 RepID=UPI0026D9A682
MDRNYARALALVLKSESGWSDNPADPGGATMKGVTLADFRRYESVAGSALVWRRPFCLRSTHAAHASQDRNVNVP